MYWKTGKGENIVGVLTKWDAKVYGVVYLGSSCQWSLMAWEAVLSTVLQMSVLGSGTSISITDLDIK